MCSRQGLGLGWALRWVVVEGCGEWALCEAAGADDAAAAMGAVLPHTEMPSVWVRHLLHKALNGTAEGQSDSADALEIMHGMAQAQQQEDAQRQTFRQQVLMK